jgi:hypothetical protein
MITYSHVQDIPLRDNVLRLETGGYHEIVIFHKAESNRGQQVVRIETFRYKPSCGGVFMNVSSSLSIEDARIEWASLLGLGYNKFDMHEFHHADA